TDEHPDPKPAAQYAGLWDCSQDLRSAQVGRTRSKLCRNTNSFVACSSASRLDVLAPGAVFPGIRSQFTYPAAYGDLLTALLALIALFAVTRHSRFARPFVAIFNIVGTLDLLDAIVLATINNAAPYMGPAYWIPAFWVPALLVTHYVVFVLLGKRWNGPM